LVADAYEEQEVGVFDIPGAFLHAEQKDITYMKVPGELKSFLLK
jgi:hypothetical protein